MMRRFAEPVAEESMRRRFETNNKRVHSQVILDSQKRGNNKNFPGNVLILRFESVFT